MVESPPPMLDTERKVNEVLADLFELDPSDIRDEWTHEDVVLWDSLQHLRLITALEQEFAIKFSMAEIRSLESIGQIRQTLRRKIE